MTGFESVVEVAALAWLESLGYAVLHLPGPQSIASRQAVDLEVAPTCCHPNIPNAQWR